MSSGSKKLIWLISLGSILEYYDFAIFIYLAPFIGKDLIPIKDQTINLIVSFAILALGAVFRILGGIFFSHMGDTKGRKNPFIYTIIFMALPTFLIALIPGINHIGIFSTVLLVIFRIFQGFAVGGEIPGAIVFGYETANINRRAIAASIVIIGINLGFLSASIISSLISSNLFHSLLINWRLAFIIGGVFGLISYFLRKNLIETISFSKYQKMLKKEIVPISLLFKNHANNFYLLFGYGCFFALFLAIFTFYLPSYLSNFYHYPIAKLLKFNSYIIIVFILSSLITGIYDKLFGKHFFLWSVTLLGIFASLIFFAYPYLTIDQILFFHLILIIPIGLICGRFPVIAASFFPVSVRYTGVSLVYNISFGLIAGSTQMILTWLIKVTNILWIPVVLIILFTIFALISFILTEKSKFINYID